MRFLCLFVFLSLASPGVAQETGQIVTDQVPQEATTPVTIGSTCCGSEHLDHGDRYYTAPEQYDFETSKDKELVEFRLLVTDSVEAPAPKPRQVVYEWDE